MKRRHKKHNLLNNKQSIQAVIFYLMFQDWVLKQQQVDHKNISRTHTHHICPSSNHFPKYKICRTTYDFSSYLVWAFLLCRGRILGPTAAIRSITDYELERNTLSNEVNVKSNKKNIYKHVTYNDRYMHACIRSNSFIEEILGLSVKNVHELKDRSGSFLCCQKQLLSCSV